MKYESSGDRNKNISIKEYLNKIKRYLREIIINLQKSDAWKIQLAIAINFISSKNVDEERAMHSNSNNKEFLSYDKEIKLLMNFLSYFFQYTKLV